MRRCRGFLCECVRFNEWIRAGGAAVGRPFLHGRTRIFRPFGRPVRGPVAEASNPLKSRMKLRFRGYGDRSGNRVRHRSPYFWLRYHDHIPPKAFQAPDVECP